MSGNPPVSGQFEESGSQVPDPNTNVSGGFGPGSGVGLDAGAKRAAQSNEDPAKGEFVSGTFELTADQIPHARESITGRDVPAAGQGQGQ